MASSKPGCSLATSAALDSHFASPYSAVERRSQRGASGQQDLGGIPVDQGEIARLDALRRSLGCSQSELARMIGISQSSLSRLFRSPSREHRRAQTLATWERLSRVESALNEFATGHPSPEHGTMGPTRTPESQASARMPPTPPATPTRLPRRVERWKRKLEMATRSGGGVTEKSPKTTYRLLIAEDDPETVALYTTLFTEEEHRLRYEITVATTVAEVIQRLRATWAKRPYDLLVMDLGLGDRSGSSGKGLLGQLGQRPRWVPPHLLVVSGISPHHLRDRLADLAKLCATFLAKPFDIDELLDSAYALVTGNKQTSRNLPSF
jgi:CheY-like chemotaxis protein